MGNRVKSLIAGLCCALSGAAQQYTGMQGLIHVPSADMDTVIVAHIGAHYVDKHMVPDGMTVDNEKFNSWTNYLTIQPFRWIEIGYGYTLWKFHKDRNKSKEIGFYAKDRYFSLRIQPIREGKWWPSVVIGANDVVGAKDDGTSSSNFYKNFYVAASKHIDLGGQLIGAHVAYRKWDKDYNKKWDGIVGGLTIQPSFYRPLRIMGEYDGDGVNIGADCTLFRYIMLQASLQQCKYPCAGLSLRIPLTRF